MKKLILLLLTILLISCATQKFYSENGRRISKKTYNTMRERRFKFIMNNMNNMNDTDRFIINKFKMTKVIKDSLIMVYYNY